MAYPEPSSHRENAQHKLLTATVSEKPSVPTPSQKSWTKESWKTIASILSGFLLGIGFALAHHFMNTTLNGNPVDSIAHLPQEWVSRIATAFTFVVKSLLVLSVGTAFTQRQWHDFQRKAIRIQDIDTLTSGRSSILSLLNVIWLKYPILCLIVLIAWTTPLAAIVAPGSLSIQNIKSIQVLQLQVPQLSFNSTFYSDTQTVQGTLSLAENNALSSVAMATVSNGQILTIPNAFSPNQTYDLTFYGPALKCSNASAGLAQNTTAFLKSMQTRSDPEHTVTFVAWTPAGLNNTFTGLTPPWTLDTTTDPSSGAGLYVMSEPISAVQVGGPQSFTECRLYNASYGVHFDFQYPAQTLTVTSLNYLSPVSWPAESTVINLDLRTSRFAHLAVMSAFGKLLVGYEKYGVSGETTRVYTSYNVFKVNWTRSDSIYSGLEQAFQNITLGLFSNPSFYESTTSTEPVAVTVTSYPSTYVYNSRDLLLAYGLAIGATLFCTILGFHAIFVNKASFHNTFSTYIRAASHLDSSWIVEDDIGADPLPERLARQVIDMRSKGMDH